MAKSMTGFGRGRAANEQMSVTVEIKSLNNRYCEINVRLPRFLNALEPQFRTQCRAHIQRGKLDCAIVINFIRPPERTVAVNVPLAVAYEAALGELSQAVAATQQEGTNLTYLASLPDVLTVADYQPDLPELAGLLEEATAEALAALLEMKRREGAHLTADILAGCRELVDLSSRLKPLADRVPTLYQAKLQERLQRFWAGEDSLPVAADRLAMEVALLADKADVHEELVRLSTHLAEMIERVQTDEAVGKSLDFYCQEVNREINTVGSKANDGGITQLVIRMKTVLETVREQVQNLE